MLEKKREQSDLTLLTPECQTANNEEWPLLYKRIKDGGQFCFMTVSPKPDKDKEYIDHLREWFSEFRQLTLVTNDLLLVIELNKKAQIHFHFMIRLYPLHNKYTFIKRFVNRWYHRAVIEPIYGHEPKLGYDYLLKQHDDVEGVLDICPIFTLKTLVESDIKTAYEQFNLSEESN